MGIVNYYHYSVYKLLVVNLTIRFAHVLAFEKKPPSGGINVVEPRCRTALSNRLTTKRTPAKKNLLVPIQLPAWSAFRLQHPCRPPENPCLPGKPNAVVDKPMHINRIECAELPCSSTARFLSS